MVTKQWIQASYTDLDGVLQYGWMTAGSAAGSTIAECPSKYCKSVQPPEWSCRQVTATSGITMFKQPCYDQTLRVSSSDLQRWDTFRYSGAYSKQTSRCGQGIRQDLCFVKARAVLDGKLQEGWVPIFRTSGKFTDAVCSFSRGSSNEVFVRSYCGKLWTYSMDGIRCYIARAHVCDSIVGRSTMCSIAHHTASLSCAVPLSRVKKAGTGSMTPPAARLTQLTCPNTTYRKRSGT